MHLISTNLPLLPEKWVCGTLWCLTTALVFWISLLHFIHESKSRKSHWTQTSGHHPWQPPRPEKFQPSQKVACTLENNSIKQNKFKTNIWRLNMWPFFSPQCSIMYFTKTCRSVYKNHDFLKTNYLLTCHSAMSMLSWNNIQKVGMLCVLLGFFSVCLPGGQEITTFSTAYLKQPKPARKRADKVKLQLIKHSWVSRTFSNPNLT